MAFKSTLNTRLILGDFHLSSKLTQVNDAWNVDMLDPTTFTDDTRRSLPGLDTSALSIEGFIDGDTATELSSWTDVTPIAYAPAGFALGNPVLLSNALKADYEVGTQVAGLASFSITAQTDGVTDYGLSLHDLTAETIDGNGTALDGLAATTGGGVAQLHVTAYSGLTSAVVTVEDSANGSSGWATIATFTTATATTSERVDISGTIRQYTRYVLDVTGTGSVTFQVSVARR